MFHLSAPMMLFLLFGGHALADFPLQGEYLAEAKNRNTALGRNIWVFALGSHALIHGMMVALITGSVILGLCETLAHALIDAAKCEKQINFWQDQLLHYGCKLLWWGILLAWTFHINNT